MSLARHIVYGSTFALSLSLFGCSPSKNDAAKAVSALRSMIEPGSAPSNSRPPVKLPNVAINLSALTPYPGGKGLIVCEPAAKSDAATAAFGSGCSRWLHLAVAGQGTMGQTPLWDSLNAARREMNKPDLRLNKADAVTLAKKLGTNYVATSEITGSPARSTLTVQLWKLPAQTPVGAPLRANGTQAQILAALPSMANSLSTALAAPKPQLVPLGAAPTDIQFLGKLPLAMAKPLPKAEQDRLKSLAAKAPLAAMLQLAAMGNGGWDTGPNGNWRADARGATATLEKLASYNALALAENSLFSGVPSQKKALDAMAAKYPANYLVAFSEQQWQNEHEKTAGRPKELAAAQRSVRAAADNQFAWTGLADVIGDMAQDVRRGRYSANLDATESAYIYSLYPLAYGASKTAVKLDPGSFYAQLEHAHTATFAGHKQEAYTAIQRAIAIRPHDSRGWNWALEIYQWKWGGDRKELLAIIDKVKADPKLFKQLYRTVHFALVGSGLENEAKQVEDEYIQDLQAQLATQPNDVQALKAMADTLYIGLRYQESGPYYLKVTQLEPRNAEAHYQYGTVEHYFNRHYRKAEKNYRIALSLNPNYADATKALANIVYYVHKDTKKAEGLYLRAISLNNDGGYHADYARLLADTGRTVEARKHAKQAIRLGYTDAKNPIWEQLGIDPD